MMHRSVITLTGPVRADAQPGARIAARAVAERRHEIEAFDDPARRVRHDDEDPLAADRHLRRAAAPGSRTVGVAYGPITVVLMLPKRSSCAAPRNPTVIRPLCSQ